VTEFSGGSIGPVSINESPEWIWTLVGEIPYLAGAERGQVAGHTLICRVERGDPVLVSFFGNLGLGGRAGRACARI
jgi:hypothetical protein